MQGRSPDIWILSDYQELAKELYQAKQELI